MRTKKSLVIIPPITTYEYLGEKLEEFPAPVIRDRIKALSEFYEKVYVIVGSFSQKSKNFQDGNVFFSRINHKNRPYLIIHYFKKYKKILRENPGCDILNMNPLWVGAKLNFLTNKENHNFTTIFISFPKQWSFPSKLAKKFFKYNLKNSSKAIAVTPLLKDYLNQLANKNISVVTNRVKNNLRKDTTPIPNSLFYAARISHEKRQDYLIDCFKLIHDKKPDTHLYLAGDGDKTSLEAKVNEMKLEGNVTFLGSLPRDIVYEWMSKCSIFSITSIHEGFGLVYLEAMGCGIPIIATNSGSTSWVIQDAGILVPPDDKEAYAKEAIKLLENEFERKHLIKKGYERVRDFSYDTWGKDLFQAIND